MLTKKHLMPALLVLICLLYATLINPSGSSLAGVPGLPAIFAVIFLIQLLGFSYAWWARTERFYDLVGSLTFITAAVLALLLNPGISVYSGLMAALVMIWALRLGSFLFLRIADVGEDQRFRKIKQSFWRFLLVPAACVDDCSGGDRAQPQPQPEPCRTEPALTAADQEWIESFIAGLQRRPEPVVLRDFLIPLV